MGGSSAHEDHYHCAANWLLALGNKMELELAVVFGNRSAKSDGVISDDAGKFAMVVECSALPRGRILDRSGSNAETLVNYGARSHFGSLPFAIE
jgi:hypothetical protein